MSAYLGACALIATFASKVVAVPAPAVGVAPANGQPVTGGCPSGEQSYVFNNVVYSICPNTDFNVDNILDTKAASPQACAETCNKTPNCKYVVYEPNGGCHVKASSANPNWKVSNYYSTITAVYQVQQGQQITGSCPFNQTTLLGKNNAVWGICPQSDYNVDNANTIKAASQAACADACTSTQGCKYTVWEPTGYCHLKVQTNNPNWKADNYYTTMASLYTLNNGQQLTNGCLGGQKQVTTSNGATFTVCPWADFNVDNVANKQVYDDKSCAEYCSQTQGCKYAVYEPPTGACFLKGSPASPNMKQSNYYTAVYASSASTGGSSGSGGSGGNPNYQPTNGAAITGNCPNAGSTYTSKNNVAFNVCPQSDYHVNNLQWVAQPDRNSCIEWCSQTAGCFYGVWDPAAKMCNSKGAPYQPTWQQNGAYDSFVMTDASYSAPNTVAKNGLWSKVISLDLIPVAAYMIPAYPVVSKFFAFASWSGYTFGGAAQHQTAYMSWDLNANTQTEFVVANTQHDQFCPGLNALADGRLNINGGNTDQATTMYDPFANTFTRSGNMTRGRGYQSSVTLSDGRGFTIGGSFTGGIGGTEVPLKDGEVYDPASNTWSALTGAKVSNMLTTYDNGGPWRTDNHAWLYSWTGGSVLQAGPSKQMNWYSTSGQGGVRGAGTRNANNDQMCGVTVMYDNGVIFSAGGSQSYSDSDGLTATHKITIKGVNTAPAVQTLPNMNYGRMYANAVVLPNGKVFIVGGQTYGKGFQDTDSVMQAEIWDPATNAYTLVAPIAVPRNYHSTLLLMPDGRVMSGGGGLCYVGGNCQGGNHPDMQFYSPSYLFDASGNAAARPQITKLASSQQNGNQIRVNPGGTLTVTLNSASGLSHVLIRMGSSTHSVNTDQRRIPLTVKSTSGNTVTLRLPNDNGVVTPGFWYYFAVASSGAHSIGQTVNVLKV
ncbi:related to galactose oxidase precursor [Moesziomyces antarcticus]|nr:related to galactose oxidase precursor [Moesziomyces antarcticus]